MLEELLARAQQYDIDTIHFGNTNHLPMALIALDKLGADRYQLDNYFASYASGLVPLSSLEVHADSFDWRAHLGDKKSFNHYLNYFDSCITNAGPRQTLVNHIDPLMLGCGAAAFHALIRLSYGIQSGNDKEISFGLAYLASHAFTVAEPKASSLSLKQIIEIANNKMNDVTVEGRLISDRMKAISSWQQFSTLNLIPQTLDLKTLSQSVARLYLETRDFTILHAVTSCHALRYVMPYVNDPTTALRHYWTSVLVAILSVPDLEFDLSSQPQKPVEHSVDLKPMLNSKDSHLIKLVWSCFDEYQHYGMSVHLEIINQLLKEEG